MRALALIAALTACGSPEQTVYVAETLREPARIAIDAWNARLSRTCPDVQLTTTPHPEADITIAYGDMSPAAEPNDQASERFGDIRVSVRARPAFLPTLLTHELGHALGLSHSPHADDIMVDPLASDREPWPSTRDVYRVCNGD